MSHSNFAGSFRQLYNQSYKEYIEFIQLNRTADLLIFNNLDLNYISQETVFSDCSHLIRSFKHQKGMTPKVCKRKYENF
ncbi:AraC family transcriptional regulator [Eubacterium sp. MSJ-13]|uniref:helix-turn-helix domain-containing protein n=1 Tax=Eubacterium sp. MSJ-13 TaxID=2841513 RepID=UPI001C0F437C|nr:AraC family transcriptional regulator [Eubacterium sp. MSJ-13]MBU5479087.1 AraC family transcriptional regulator [Eubacterium sp. MSJ-13]